MLRRSMDPAAFPVSRSSFSGQGGWVEADWQPMGGPEGSSALFKSQSAATPPQHGNGDQHIGVFAVSPSGDAAAAWPPWGPTTMTTTTGRPGTWSSWTKFRERMAGPRAVCTGRGGDREERAGICRLTYLCPSGPSKRRILTTANATLVALPPSAQSFLHAQTPTTGGSSIPKMSTWDQSFSHGCPSSTVPAVICRQSGPDRTPLYDLLYAYKTAVCQTSFFTAQNSSNSSTWFSRRDRAAGQLRGRPRGRGRAGRPVCLLWAGE